MEIIKTIGDPKPSPPVGVEMRVQFAGDTKIQPIPARSLFKLEGMNREAYDTLIEAFSGETAHSAFLQRGGFTRWEIEIPYEAETYDEVLEKITEIARQFNLIEESKELWQK